MGFQTWKFLNSQCFLDFSDVLVVMSLLELNLDQYRWVKTESE